MVENRTPSERRPTGVAGLDRILEGGLLASGVYIVQGPPGAGKTILANQICFHHASTGGHAVYVTLLAESHSRMFGHLRRMSFFDEAAIPDHVYYIGGYSTLESEGLEALVTLIRGAIQKHQATMLVVDGLISAQESAPTDREFKRFLHETQTLADLTGCTVILLTNAERASGFFPEHTMVDGVLHLTDELSELRPLRHVRVLKLRGSAPVRGLHSVRITDHGLEVRPRIESHFLQGAVGEDAVAAGAEAGVRRGRARRHAARRSPPGLDHDAAWFLGQRQDRPWHAVSLRGRQANERVVYFGFYERPESILAKCQRVGIGGLKEGVERGLAQIIWHRPVEGVIDELGESLIETVRKTRAQRLFLDGMEGFERAADFPERISHVYSAIAQELERLGRHDDLHHRDARTVRPEHRGADQRAVGGDAEHHPAASHRASSLHVARAGDSESARRRLRREDARVSASPTTGIRLLDTFAAESSVASGGGVSKRHVAQDSEE